MDKTSGYDPEDASSNLAIPTNFLLRIMVVYYEFTFEV